MKKVFCLGIALLFVFSFAPAMAADQSLPKKGGMSLAKMTDQELSSVQGGYIFSTVIISLPGLSRRYTNPGSIDEVVEVPPNRRYVIKYRGWRW